MNNITGVKAMIPQTRCLRLNVTIDIASVFRFDNLQGQIYVLMSLHLPTIYFRPNVHAFAADTKIHEKRKDQSPIANS